jgi:hypothetical protein
MMKVLTWWQACWSEYLSTFNMVIHFRPGHLSGKPDAMTRQWDVYPKEGGSDYAMVNLHNFKPIFTLQQFTMSICATYLIHPIMHSVILMDVEKLHQDILMAILCNLITQEHYSNSDGPASPGGLRTPMALLGLIDIYVLDVDSLHLYILQYCHNHPISGHFGINKTLALI